MANPFDELRKAKAELRAYVESLSQRQTAWTKLANSSAAGDADAVEGWPTEGDEPDGQRPARRTESWGVHGRPPAGVLTAVVRAMGGAAANLIVGISTGRYGRQDLKVGETQLYCKVAGCEVFMDEHGTLQINTPVGQDVQVNQGAAKVAVHGDSTAGHTHTIPPIAVVNGSGTPIGTTTAAATAVATDTINVTSSRRFKA